MKIGIDARLIHETGVGRYIKNLLGELSTLDDHNEYIIYLPPQGYTEFEIPNKNWKKKIVTARWHSLSEQLILPFLYLADRIDILHVPYFTVPVFFPGKIVCTIHDLTILHEKTGKATTLPAPLYALKHFGYRCVVSLGVRRSAKIITVSHTVERELVRRYHLSVNKVQVIYEGIDAQLLKTTPRTIPVSGSYFLYVGNVYPHKNAELLLSVIEAVNKHDQIKEKVSLIFVGKEDFFYRRLQVTVAHQALEHMITFLGHVTDETLAGLYHHAVATVFPSKMEGFGLPAIESLGCDCPIIVSDIPVFRELLTGPGVTFVPHDKKGAWVEALRVALSKKANKTFWQSPAQKQEFLSQFSWRRMAESTLKIYEDSYRL